MKTVTVLNERAKLIPVHDLNNVAIMRVFFDTDGDGNFSQSWNWSKWETIPTEFETIYE